MAIWHSEKIWTQLISCDHQGKCGERENCVHQFMCVDVSGKGEVFGFITICQSIFLKCDLNLKKGNASMHQRLDH